MPYNPTIPPPDVAAELRPRNTDNDPTDCDRCGDLLAVVNENGEAFAAECRTCGVEVVSNYPDEYEWVYPEGGES
jgi:hypothetical protein